MGKNKNVCIYFSQSRVYHRLLCLQPDLVLQGLYSLRRHRHISIGIPIINLRRSSDRLRFIMGIPIPIRRRLLSAKRPWRVSHCSQPLLSVVIWALWPVCMHPKATVVWGMAKTYYKSVWFSWHWFNGWSWGVVIVFHKVWKIIGDFLLWDPVFSLSFHHAYIGVHSGYGLSQWKMMLQCKCLSLAEPIMIILGMGSANERWCYIVISSFIGWAHSHFGMYICEMYFRKGTILICPCSFV